LKHSSDNNSDRWQWLAIVAPFVDMHIDWRQQPETDALARSTGNHLQGDPHRQLLAIVNSNSLSRQPLELTKNSSVTSTLISNSDGDFGNILFLLLMQFDYGIITCVGLPDHLLTVVSFCCTSSYLCIYLSYCTLDI